MCQNKLNIDCNKVVMEVGIKLNKERDHESKCIFVYKTVEPN